MAIKTKTIKRGTAAMQAKPIVHSEAILAWTVHPRPPVCVWVTNRSAKNTGQTVTMNRDDVTCPECQKILLPVPGKKGGK